MKKQWIMWFNDSDWTIISGVKELREQAIRFNFDAEEVLAWGEVNFTDDDGNVDGGVFFDAQ